MLFEIWNRIIFVNVPDPDDARRRRLLNVILLGVSTITLVLVFSSFLESPTGGANRFAVLGSFFLLFNYGLYLLNRRVSGLWASFIFISILTALIVYSDSPVELVAGRSLFFFSVPIVFASVLLRPWMSFGIAIICSIVSVILAYQAGIAINTFAIAGFIVLALFSWLSSSAIETALEDLRNINHELDQRVAARTEELAVANERLKELDRLRSKFVGDVSHELRTPVSNLVAYLEMFETKTDDPERRKRYLDVLQEETSRLEGLVNSVLNLSRLDLGGGQKKLEAIQINDVAEQVFLANHTRGEAHGLKMGFEPGDDLPIIWADSNQINQVFNNIIGNAVNYTMRDGKIRVKTYADKEAVVLEVSDTGIGIPKNDIPYLFERFFRGHNAGSSTIPGSGLGLAITKEIVDSYGGTIEVESEHGKGTIFRVILPVLHEPPVFVEAEANA